MSKEESHEGRGGQDDVSIEVKGDRECGNLMHSAGSTLGGEDKRRGKESEEKMRQIRWWGVKVARWVWKQQVRTNRLGEGGEVFSKVELQDLRVSRKVVSGLVMRPSPSS